jgi:hypothetical protein
MQLAELVALCLDRDWQKVTELFAAFLQQNGISVSTDTLASEIRKHGPLTVAFMGLNGEDPEPRVLKAEDTRSGPPTSVPLP